MNGQSSTDETHHYQFIHENSGAGSHYYRIKQVDVDGKSTFSKVVKIGSADTASTIRIYPVPATDKVTIEMNVEQRLTVVVSIQNASGGIVSSEKQTLSTGINKIELALDKLTPGMYMIRVSDGKQHLTVSKIIKQ